MINIYEELAYDLFANTELTMLQAREVVSFLKREGILDEDIVKEYYTDD